MKLPLEIVAGQVRIARKWVIPVFDRSDANIPRLAANNTVVAYFVVTTGQMRSIVIHLVTPFNQAKIINPAENNQQKTLGAFCFVEVAGGGRGLKVSPLEPLR